MIEWERNDSGECKTLKGVPKGATVVAVDGVECVGACEICGKPVLENQPRVSYEEGIVVHKTCDGEGAPKGIDRLEEVIRDINMRKDVYVINRTHETFMGETHALQFTFDFFIDELARIIVSIENEIGVST